MLGKYLNLVRLLCSAGKNNNQVALGLGEEEEFIPESLEPRPAALGAVKRVSWK